MCQIYKAKCIEPQWPVIVTRMRHQKHRSPLINKIKNSKVWKKEQSKNE